MKFKSQFHFLNIRFSQSLVKAKQTVPTLTNSLMVRTIALITHHMKILLYDLSELVSMDTRNQQMETTNAKALTIVMLVPTIVTIGMIALTLRDHLIAVARPEHLMTVWLAIRSMSTTVQMTAIQMPHALTSTLTP